VGRRNYIAIGAAVALSILVSGSTFAQGSPHSPRKRGGGGGFGQRRHEVRGGPRERFYQLSPEERQTFQKNAERWLQMDPQQRQLLRERERVRREHMKREAEAAMRQLDLRLDQKARAQFEERYLQERRRIERELRQEVEAKRQRELPQLNERLKGEFQPRQASPSASVSPTGSTKNPGK
jgi:hypothetical protein